MKFRRSKIRAAVKPKVRTGGGRGWRTLGWVFAVVLILTATGRALLPWAVRDYVNRTLDRNILYSGKIGDVHLHLLRGAYSIHDINISKTTANVPVPFFSAQTVDFAVQWDALIHGKLVGRVLIVNPEINFVDAPNASESQTGTGAPWLEVIRDLFPFRINRMEIKNGSVHFRALNFARPVDVYVSHVQAVIDNLTNIQEETDPLIASVQASGLVMDQGKLEYKMTLDPSSYRPTFHLAVRLLDLDVTKLNELALAYGKFDFKRGWFDFVLETDAKEGLITGYVKPLFRNLKVFSLSQDVQEDNVLQFFWQALVGAATAVFKNQSRDQFGTLIPFTADLTGATSTDILGAVGNLLRNAFVRAYLPQLESGEQGVGGLQFTAPEVTSPSASGNSS